MPIYPPRQWAAHLRALAGAAGPAGSPGGGAGPDAALWRAVDRPGLEVDKLFDAPGTGPLWPWTGRLPIEVWTEQELCGLHALWWLARRPGREHLARRTAVARDWHLVNTQPDNASNRPWALHVFLLGEAAESRLYAETLLHNCLVGTGGRLEPLSAWILLDSARALEKVSG